VARPTIKATVKQRCVTLRTVLTESGAVSADEIAPHWPRGALNPRGDTDAWVRCAMQLARFSARAEARQEFTTGAHESRSAELVALLANTPRDVHLLVPIRAHDGADAPRMDSVRIGYRSWTALRYLSAYARIASQLTAYIAVLDDSPEQSELILEAHTWHERMLLMLCWGATFDDETGRLPWDPRRDRWPDVPKCFEALSVVDRLNIQRAYADVHGRALAVLTPFFAPDDDRDPLGGWHTFFASYAAEHDVSVDTLMDARPFMPFLAQLMLAAQTARHANERAKQQHAQPQV
jgi:hypothetical protein